MNNKSIIAIILYDICALGIFLTLSILFNRWWVILFSLLFIHIPTTTIHSYRRICDNCGKRSKPMSTSEEALASALKDGWVHYANTNTDYCPECKSKMTREDSNE